MRVANANMQPVWVKVTYNDKTVNYEHRGRRAGGEVGALNAKVGFHFGKNKAVVRLLCLLLVMS